MKEPGRLQSIGLQRVGHDGATSLSLSLSLNSVITYIEIEYKNSGSFGRSNQSRKRNKRNPNWKRRSQTLNVGR